MTDEHRPKRVTMQDVARRANVSRALVSLVMRGRDSVAPESRAKVLKAAEDLGYVPNLLASKLASQRTNTVGVLLDSLQNTFFAEIYEGIVDGLAGTPVQPLLAVGSLDPQVEAFKIQRLRSHQVDGLILAGYVGDVDALARFAQSIPTVVTTRAVNVPFVDSVLADDLNIGRLATEHLLELGHREILHVGSPQSIPHQERGEGYERAMAAARCEPFIVRTDHVTPEDGRRAVTTALADGRPFTAVFAFNDFIAIGVMEALIEAGYRIPEDVSVIGVDYTHFAKSSLIRLASVDQRTYEVGKLAAERFFERLDSPAALPHRETRLDPVLRLGTTTSPR
ncbi:LacI family DNA-binding transcriptional regulator [Gulosibacter sp. 10]|uniref:LacI family DNA-binding transcriptional regulator n=1 Tax=Gulosibacter sp. 10 TaxID=1255570 RepID=UPI00097E8E95|nr:LacI family DNA-binding transcriptional regulator [Gulosibacter sp. 10]SJM51682.1 transcriptional regulator, LacI family [Gulosibacter sp. 10]